MADQTSMRNGPDVRIHAPFTEGVIGNIAEFGNDTFELVELQAKLAAYDAREWSAQALIHAVLTFVGLLLIVGLVPVALAGLALAIHEPLGVSIGVALLMTAGSALILAAILTTIAMLGFQRSLRSFDRSREEFTRNFSWMKTVLSNSGQQVDRSKGARSYRGGR